VLAALVRRLQGWSLTSVYSEYERFAGSKIADEEVRHVKSARLAASVL
jgi:hypothetical protein